MHYEVYADSLFLLHFFLNFYALELVNHMLYKAISHKRILWGSGLGAICSLLPFFFPLPLWISVLCSLGLSASVLIVFTFRAYRRSLFAGILEKIMIATLVLGGLLLCFVRIFPFKKDSGVGLIGILFLGGVCYIGAEVFLHNKKTKEHTCLVTLQAGDKITIEALLDTGNSLTEPISGKPAAVLAQSVFEELYRERTPKGFRLIPYHSIDNQNGMMSGYLLDSVVIEMEGVKKEYQQIYVGICPDAAFQKSSYQMILNPRMLG